MIHKNNNNNQGVFLELLVATKKKISSNILRPPNTKYSAPFFKFDIWNERWKVMILTVPCNKSVPSYLSVKSVLNNRQIKNRRDILLRDKIKFQDCILATVFVYIGSRKTKQTQKSIPENSRQTSGAWWSCALSTGLWFFGF